MGRMPWATYLWPGLPRICRDGHWPALAAAVGFAALVNLALMTSLLWTELFAAEVRTWVWLAVGILWSGSAVLSYRRDTHISSQPESDPAQDAFADAVDRYLQGDWFRSERTLDRLLTDNPRDVDAGLMLATLLRRTGRPGEAERQLDRIERFEGSRKWQLEIRRERELLVAVRDGTAGDPLPGTVAAASDPHGGMADAA